MYKILLISTLFFSNLVLAGKFARLFQPEVSRHQKYARKLVSFNYEGREEVIKSLYANTLVSMKRWLEAKERAAKIGSVEPYTMDAQDNTLLARVTRRAQKSLD